MLTGSSLCAIGTSPAAVAVGVGSTAMLDNKVIETKIFEVNLKVFNEVIPLAFIFIPLLISDCESPWKRISEEYSFIGVVIVHRGDCRL